MCQPFSISKRTTAAVSPPASFTQPADVALTRVLELAVTSWAGLSDFVAPVDFKFDLLEVA